MERSLSHSPNTILVTGANGQLGMELRDLASNQSSFSFVFLSREELPIENDEAIKSVFEKYRPQYLINCAAYTAVDKAESEKEQAFLINSAAVGILARNCKEFDTQLIHISTDYVFNGKANAPYHEDSPTDPVNMYGASKLDGENQALTNDPAVIIIRTSWVYSSYGKNFVKTMLRLMNEKKEISVVNDQFGSPTYAADLAEGIIGIIKKIHADSSSGNYAGIYHYSNDGLISWYDLALAIKELSGSNCIVHPIPTSSYPTPAKRPLYSALDKTKVQDIFKIELKDWKQSLAACIKKTLKSF